MITMTPSENGKGCMAIVERSQSASACASSSPVGWWSNHRSGTARYRSVTRWNHSICMRRWAICPKYRRRTTPTIRRDDATTNAAAPTATVPRSTPPSKAGIRTSSVTRPSTMVPPTAMIANRVAPPTEMAKGPGWARTDNHSSRTPRRMIPSPRSSRAMGRT